MEEMLKTEFATELKHLLELIQDKYGYDFRNYSSNSIDRRVMQALVNMKYPNLLALQNAIMKEESKFLELIQYLTVSVSEAFRDPTYFSAVRAKIVPFLKTYPSLKIWVAGCSTGEEVFSLAVLFKEEGLLDRTTFYATDINSKSLSFAEKGIFPLSVISKFKENYLSAGGINSFSSHYNLTKDSMQFSEDLRKNITFFHHSLVTDAVFSETHFISCRNVLIYFDRTLQDKVLRLFSESLCRKGFLGLGTKETLQFSTQANHFEAIDKKERIFQKK